MYYYADEAPGAIPVLPMIAHPLVDAVLEGNRIAHGQNQLQRPLGFERLVRPVTVRTGRDAHGSECPVHVTYI